MIGMILCISSSPLTDIIPEGKYCNILHKNNIDKIIRFLLEAQ